MRQLPVPIQTQISYELFVTNKWKSRLLFAAYPHVNCSSESNRKSFARLLLTIKSIFITEMRPTGTYATATSFFTENEVEEKQV